MLQERFETIKYPIFDFRCMIPAYVLWRETS